MKPNILIITVLLLVAGALACEGPSADENIISLAPIHEVDIAVAESFPEQIFVYIKGGLPDGCTEFHELKEEREGTTITITVTNIRPKNAICTQVYGFFGQNVNLGSDFASGETYIVKVNHETREFTYP